MINYNPKDWFGLIFRFHKSDTFRTLFWVIVSVSLYSWLVIYIELEVIEMNFSSSVMHSLLGFVISLLLVFRTNTAYDRWWEGRKQWGALVNVSRNFAFKISTWVKNAEAKPKLMRYAVAYPHVLTEHLRKADYSTLPDKHQLLIDDLKKDMHHIPNALAKRMQKMVDENSHDLDTAKQLALIEDLNAFTDICGACERIRKTPIPYTYNIFIKKFIFIYIITMPIGFAGTFGYWTILITSFTFYILASLELIAESIEDPFGLDSDDLPTDTLAENIERNVEEIMS
ncbi:MAG: bestrophin family protein [Salibacteraceae bacterium]